MTRRLRWLACAGLLAALCFLPGTPVPAEPQAAAERVSPLALGGDEWVLRAWDTGEAAPAEPEVTLVYAKGRFAGSSGCNRYAATVTEGETPGDVALGPAIGTRMSCPQPVMDVESRFLAQLAGARKLAFNDEDHLSLSYEKDGRTGTMLFARRVETGEQAREPQAMEIVTRMAQRLATAERLAFHIEAAYDAIQRDGQTVEFGGSRDVTLRRPDRLRVAAVDRSVGHKLLVWDGRMLSYWAESQKAFAQVPRSGTIDDVIHYLVTELGLSLPLAELISARLPQLLEQDIVEAGYVGVETLSGVECDHLVFRNENVNFQLWVERGDEPLPRRTVIVYEHAEGRPQFRADLSDWNLSPRTPDSLFEFKPPDGAERVSFLSRQPAAGEVQ